MLQSTLALAHVKSFTSVSLKRWQTWSRHWWPNLDFSILEQTSYPNQLVAGNVFDRQAPLWLEQLGQRSTYLHNQLFVLMAYCDLIIARTSSISPETLSHMNRALGLLQRDLGLNNRATAELTIYTIITFAMVEFMSGDTVSAEKHLQGLFKVVALRGGLSSLKSCRYLQTKCCRPHSEIFRL